MLYFEWINYTSSTITYIHIISIRKTLWWVIKSMSSVWRIYPLGGPFCPIKSFLKDVCLRQSTYFASVVFCLSCVQCFTTWARGPILIKLVVRGHILTICGHFHIFSITQNFGLPEIRRKKRKICFRYNDCNQMLLNCRF